ncbi:putative ribonuclease H-like domain-containing protein [Tanacetum coccineum]
MEARTTSTTLTAKLPILNPVDYDLWLIRIEQYFLMTDYSLSEVIKNGNKVLKRTVEETEQEYEPTTAKEKHDRRNEMKARGTLLMALPNKDQLKLQKLITQLEIQGKVITQEDMNLKLLRSLPSEWKTHALIWRNKQGIETISLDDFYNNLKIYEPEISGSSRTSQNLQNVAFMSSNSTNNNSSTNEADNTAYGVSAAHTQCNSTSGDNLKQIDPDDPEEMDLQWEMDMLTIRARRFIKRTCSKLDVNGQRVRFDKTKVKGREINRRTVIVETPTENALVAQDGIRGYDWSYQAEKEHLINFALMANTSSGSSSSSDSKVDSCSKSCVEAYATLKEQYNSLSSDYKRSQFNLVSYKAGLESVEARLAHYKKNEVVYEESINVLNLELKLRDNVLVENKKKLEKAEKERDELKLTLEKFQNSSKSLNNLLESQVIDKFKTRLGYNAASSTAASPAVESFVNSSGMLENQEYINENMDVTTVVTPSNVKTVESNLESAGVKSNGDAVEPKTIRKNSFRPPVIEDWNSDDESEVEIIPKDKTVSSSTEKINFVKTARETVEKVIRPVWNNSSRVNHKNFANKMTHPHPNRKFVPQAVLTRSGKINTTGASVNTAVRPVNTAGSKPTMNHPRPISNAYKKGYSQVTRPFNKYSEYKNSIFNKKLNIVRVKDTTARDKAVVSENIGIRANAVKASAWATHNRRSTRKNELLTVMVKEEFLEKGKIKTGTLDFDNVYFCKELKYILFSVSQIFNKKNNVLFTDTECLVLSSDFKLLDESQVLLRVPRKDNIYSVDLKSVNGFAERRNRTLIEAARTMLVDSKLPTTFWAEAVNTTCYVLNKVLVIKPYNKTPYELIRGRNPLIDFIKPFGCPITILNTRDHLDKFDGKANEGFFVGYSIVSKAIRVFNKRTRIVEETLNIRFLKNTPNVTGNGPDWLLDVDSLTICMNYVPVVAGNQTNSIVGTRDNIVTDPKVSKEDAEEKPTDMDKNGASDKDGKDDHATRSNTPVSAAGPSFTNDDTSSPVNNGEASNTFEEHLFERFSPFKNAFTLPPVSNVTSMDDTRIFGNAYDDEDVGAEADLNNLETTMNVSSIPTIRIDKDHPKDQISGDFNSAIQTRRMTKISDEHAMMDVKSAFLYGTIDEEVYVCQPCGFEDPQFPDKVYKVEKALYGLHQAPRAWYETLSTYLIENRFGRGIIDKTLFIKKDKGDILLVQVYVDNIIFGSTKKSLCDEFEGLMHKRFQMSSMGELTFFLGLQVQQKKDDIFISQDKYVADILKKFVFSTVKTASTPMEPNKALIKDEEADSVDVHLYRSMIGSLMYLTASKPDITLLFVLVQDSPFDLEAFFDSDYAGASLDKKSTTRAAYVAAANCCG